MCPGFKSGRSNEVVELTGFSNKKMTGRLFGTEKEKNGCNNEVSVITGSPKLGFHCKYFISDHMMFVLNRNALLPNRISIKFQRNILPELIQMT